MEEMVLNDHRDSRGFVVNPFEHLADTGNITNCHAFTIQPGCSRGNHLHPGRNEQVLVLAGEVTVETPAGSATLTADKPAILTIPRGTGHIFLNTSEEPSVVLCWSSSREMNYTGEDTVRNR